MSFIRFLGAVWPMLLVSGLAGNVGIVAVAMALGLKIKAIEIFYGRPLWSVETRLAKVNFGYLPIGGYVSFDDDTFDQMSPAQRILLALGGSVTVMATSVACLGWQPSLHALSSGFGQWLFFLNSSFFSVDSGVVMLRAFQAKETVCWLHATGILAAKMTALAWIPTPLSVSGHILQKLSKRLQQGRYARAVQLACRALLFMMVMSWLLAGLEFLFKG